MTVADERVLEFTLGRTVANGVETLRLPIAGLDGGDDERVRR